MAEPFSYEVARKLGEPDAEKVDSKIKEALVNDEPSAMAELRQHLPELQWMQDQDFKSHWLKPEKSTPEQLHEQQAGLHLKEQAALQQDSRKGPGIFKKMAEYQDAEAPGQRDLPDVEALKATPSAEENAAGIRVPSTIGNNPLKTWDDLLRAQKENPGTRIKGAGTSVQLQDASTGAARAQPESSFFEVDPFYENPDKEPAFTTGQQALHALTGTGDPLQQTVARTLRGAGKAITGAPPDELNDKTGGYGFRAAGRDAGEWLAQHGRSLDPNPSEVTRRGLAGLAGVGAGVDMAQEAGLRGLGWLAKSPTAGQPNAASEFLGNWADKNSEEADRGLESARQVLEPQDIPDTQENREDLMKDAGEIPGTAAQMLSPTSGVAFLKGLWNTGKMVAPAVKASAGEKLMAASPAAQKSAGWLSANPAAASAPESQAANLAVMSQAARNQGETGATNVLARSVGEGNPHEIEPLTKFAEGHGFEAGDVHAAPDVIRKTLAGEGKVLMVQGQGGGNFVRQANELKHGRTLHLPDDLPPEVAQKLAGNVMDEQSALAYIYANSEKERHQTITKIAHFMDDLLGTSGASQIETKGNWGFDVRNRVEELARVHMGVPGAFDNDVKDIFTKVANGESGNWHGTDTQELLARIQEGGTLGTSHMSQVERNGPTLPFVRLGVKAISPNTWLGKGLRGVDAGAGMARDSVSWPASKLGSVGEEMLKKRYFPGAPAEIPLEDCIKIQSVLGKIKNGESVDAAIANTNKLLINFQELSGAERLAKTMIPFAKYNTSMHSGSYALALSHPERFRHLYSLARAVEQTDTSLNNDQPVNQKFKGPWEAMAGYPLVGGKNQDVWTLKPPTPVAGMAQHAEMLGNSLDPDSTGPGLSGLLAPAFSTAASMLSGKNHFGQPASGMKPASDERVWREARTAVPHGWYTPFAGAYEQTAHESDVPPNPIYGPNMLMGDMPYLNASVAAMNTTPGVSNFTNSSLGQNAQHYLLDQPQNPGKNTDDAKVAEMQRLLLKAGGLTSQRRDMSLVGGNDRAKYSKKPMKSARDIRQEELKRGRVEE